MLVKEFTNICFFLSRAGQKILLSVVPICENLKIGDRIAKCSKESEEAEISS